ncbi:MAG: hypothetical protein RSF35_09555 [Akkermansia sp.]
MEKYRIAPAEQIMCDFLLGEGSKGIATPTITTVLKEKVDVAALTYAVNAAMAFHPYFATRLIREDNTFYWQENTRPPVISERQIFEDFLFGDKSNHFYPWTITYFDHSIYFDFAHELADGGGITVFCSTLMEYYTRYISGDMTPIAEKSTREERIEREMAFPSQIAHRQGARYLYQPRREKVSKFCPERVGAVSNSKRFCIDSTMLRKISARYDASPFAVITPILARASMPYLSGEHKIAKLLVPQDVRGFFDSQSLHNFSIAHPFYYFDDKMRDMPLEQVATIFRSRLDLLSDMSNVEAFYTSLYEMGQQLHIPEVRAKARNAFEMQVYLDTTIAYVHVTRSKISEAAGKHISNVYLNDIIPESMICCVGENFGDHINLTIGTHFLDDGFFENVCAQLDELGVVYSMEAADVRGQRYFIFSDDADC